MLSALSEGDAVVVVPMGTDLTTQEAANLLGVSRPYLIRLINQGRIPCEWVGSHRRIRVEDVLAYRRSSQAKQRGALRQLADETDSANLRYSEDE
jgi:excisionase family DNA binding protein